MNKTKDDIVTELMNQMADRSNIGILKYKNTMKKTKMNQIQAIENAIEELLDGAVYLKKAVHEMKLEEQENFRDLEHFGGTDD
jgi:hypothetical protein